jgi:hypothetical protein
MIHSQFNLNISAKNVGNDKALKRRAIASRRSAAQGKTWTGVTVLLSEQVGVYPTFLME